jgi:hypothetical protein
MDATAQTIEEGEADDGLGAMGVVERFEGDGAGDGDGTAGNARDRPRPGRASTALAPSEVRRSEDAAGADGFEREVSSIADRVRALRSEGLTPKEIRAALPEATPWAVNCAINRDATAIAAHPGLRARAKDEDREHARALRLEGKTYDQILKQVRASKASLSLWLRDLPYPDVNRAAKAAHMHRVRAERIEEQRRRTKSEAFEQIGVLTERELMLVGAALYWSEGAKDKPYARRESVLFINSDPDMIRVFLAWLRRLGVPLDQCRFRISIHETAVLSEAEEYWRDITGASAELFYRPAIKRHNPKTVRYRTGDDYHGCIAIQVLKCADLYRRFEGWWRGIAAATVACDVTDLATESRLPTVPP